MLKKSISALLAIGILSGSVNIASAELETPLPSGWYMSKSGGFIGDAVVTDDKAYSGKCSLHITSESGYQPNRFGHVYTNVRLEQGKTYKYGYQIKALRAHEMEITFQWNGTRNAVPMGSTCDWNRVEYKYTHNGATGTYNFGFLLNSTIKDAWVDDMFIFEIDDKGNNVGVNMLPKTGFERDDSDVTVIPREYTFGEEVKENALSGAEFSSSAFEGAYGAFDTVPSFDISNGWDVIPKLSVPELKPSETEKTGVDDTSATLQFAHDAENVYMRVDVTDKTHVIDTEYPDKGDSIQFKFNINDVEQDLYILGYGKESRCYGYLVGRFGEIYDVTAIVSRNGDHTVYEVKVPNTYINLTDNSRYALSFNVYDNDGEGPKGAKGLLKGLVNVVAIPERDVYGFFEKETGEYEVNSDIKLPVYVVNTSAEGKKITVNINDKYKEEILLKPRSVYAKNYKISYDVEGEQEIKLSLNDEVQTVKKVSIKNTKKICDAYIERLNHVIKVQVPEINSLISKCKSMGLPTDYEDMSVYMIKRFAEEHVVDVEKRQLYWVDNNVSAIEKMAENAVNNLKAYISGEKVALAVPQYMTSVTTFDEDSEYARTTDGTIRPVFFTGYGHFDAAIDDIPNFNKMGANIVQRELALNDIISYDGGVKVNESGVDYYIEKLFDSAEKNNVQVDYLITPHYIQRIGGLANINGYNMYDPRVVEIMEAFCEAVFPKLANYNCLHSVCLTNEPGTWTAGTQERYVEHLKTKYNGDINFVNSIYDTSYTAFEEIMIPEQKTYSRPKEELTMGEMNYVFDYMEYNADEFTAYHEWLAGLVKKYLPDVKVHCKMMNNLITVDDWSRFYLNLGVDMERLNNALDLNGCDGFNFINRDAEILMKEFGYDRMRSYNKAMAINSEDHYLVDGETKYIPELRNHIYTDIWQCGIHGRGTSIGWVWERTYDLGGAFGGAIRNRPDCIEAIAYATADLNRLSYEARAMYSKEPTAVIYYDDNARFRNEYFAGAANQAYRALYFNGQRVGSVSDAMITDGELSKYKLLVIPEVEFIEENSAKKIADYINAGGKVIVLGENSFMYDEYGRTLPQRDFLLANSTVIKTAHKPGTAAITAPEEYGIAPIFSGCGWVDTGFGKYISEQFNGVLKELGLMNIEVIDARTNEQVYLVESSTAELGNLNAKVSNSAATFTWTEPEDDDFFKVRIYDITGGGKKLLKEVDKGTVSYVARKLKNETEYEYLFTTVDTMDNESEGTKIKFIPVIPPAKPAVEADDENDVIIGGNSAMEIKVDAGEWTDYTDGLVFEGNHVVLVRVKASGHYPSSANTLLIFKKPQTEFEKLPIQLTKADFYKNSFKFAGIVKGGVNADVTAVIRKGESFADYLYAKQLVTDEEGRFEAEAVLADMRGDTDMSGRYTFAVNSSDGIKSQEITINFASENLRKEAIEHLNSSKNLRDTVEKYESTFNTLGIDVTEYLESADKQKYIDDVVENILPIEKTDDALQSIFEEAQFVYDINNADGVSEIQSLILASPYEFKYKESTVFEMLSEDEDVAQRAMEIVGMTDDYKSAKEIEDEFEFGCALYQVCHAQYSTLKKILEDNEDELGIKGESEYEDYLDESDNTAVNKYFVRNAYPDKISSRKELLSLLEKSAEKADEKSSGGSGGGGGGGGSSISPSKGLSNVGAITSTPVADNGNTNTQSVKPSSVFTDLAGSEWAENAITALYKKGIVSGSGDGRFYPGNNITREEFLKLVIEAFNIKANDENTDFADAAKGAWYCKYINAAVNNGIVTGKDNGTFGIGENITRQDMAVILYRTSKALGYEFGVTKEVSFTDSENISDYAVEAVMALSNAGIINGMENGLFAPLENATRAQGAQIIYNVLSERGDV